MDIQKIKKRTEVTANLTDNMGAPLMDLCDEVQRNRDVLAKLIVWLVRELGQQSAQTLINELQAE